MVGPCDDFSHVNPWALDELYKNIIYNKICKYNSKYAYGNTQTGSKSAKFSTKVIWYGNKKTHISLCPYLFLVALSVRFPVGGACHAA